MQTENEKQLTAVMQVEIALDKYERWIEGNHKAEKFDLSDLQNAIKQALTTERQQLIDAYWAGLNGSMNDYSETKVINNEMIGIKNGGGAEQYFNNKFNPQ